MVEDINMCEKLCFMFRLVKIFLLKYMCKKCSSVVELYEYDECWFADVRRWGGVRGKQPVVEENSIDDPIDADVENSEVDFQQEIVFS